MWKVLDPLSLRGRKPIFKSVVCLMQKWSICFMADRQAFTAKNSRVLLRCGKHKKIGMTAGIFIEICEYDHTIIQA